jgi:hypothetical protein
MYLKSQLQAVVNNWSLRSCVCDMTMRENMMVISGREGSIRSETMSTGANAHVNDDKMAGHGLYTRDRPNFSGKGSSTHDGRNPRRTMTQENKAMSTISI